MAVFNYICETTSFPQSVQILEESTNDMGIPKVIFKAKLQSADEKNQNRRIYSMAVCESITKQLQEKAQDRSLLMEVD